MSTRNILISLFWIIVVLGLVYSFYSPEEKKAATRPNNNPAHPFVIPPSHFNPGKGNGLRQSRYLVEFHKTGPNKGTYLARITVVNESNQTLKNIKIHVRPFRGTDDPEGDTEMDEEVDEFSPISQFGDWVDVPDLKPRASAEVTYSFPQKLPYQPDENPGPVFKYTTESGEEIVTPDLVATAAAQKDARLKAALKASRQKALQK